MRIVFLSMEYPPETGWGGIGTFVRDTARTLAGRGHDVHVLSCVPGQQKSDRVDEGVVVHRRPRLARRLASRPHGGLVSRIATASSCALELRRLKLDVDVVEAPEYMAEGLLVAMSRTPVVTMIHSSGVLVAPSGLAIRVINLVERFAVRRSDAVIGPSRLVVDRLETLGWVRPNETWIVPLPVVGTPFEVAARPSGETRWIVQVGRLEPGKAPELTLRAVARLRERRVGTDIRIAFLGASNGEWNGASYDIALRQEAERLGVPCEVLGKVSREIVGQWLSRAWLLAAPSLRDSGPLVALEAMSAGVPVVCTDACGVAAEIAEAGAGAVFPVGDAQACSDALAALLGAEQRAAARLAALRLAHDVHDPELVASQREAVYRSVQRRITEPGPTN